MALDTVLHMTAADRDKRLRAIKRAELDRRLARFKANEPKVEEDPAT